MTHKQLSSQGFNGNSAQIVDTFRKKIENYSFLMTDRIGKGFSSIVYRGVNELTNEVVAIKVIDLKSLKDDVAKSMLDSELECIKSLNHTNLLKCYDTYTTVNNCYIITEYCNQGDLASKLKSRGKYSEEEFKQVFEQIYLGYSRLHDKGYIHRDLKPANILLKNGVIKIADFGFVKRQAGSMKESYNVGTPLYMSPEAMKDNVYTVKNDIWSLGVMSYELLAGKVPWECRSQAQLKEKVARNSIKFDSLNVSAQLRDLLQRCLEISQSRRITLEQIEKHTWVRRILKTPSLDAVLTPSAPLSHEFKSLTVDGTLNRTVSQGVQRYVKPFQTAENPESPQHSPVRANLDALTVLASMLNYCRFNYKVQNKLFECGMRRYQIEELVSYMQSDLLTKMNLHDYILRTKSNIIQVNGWTQFVSGQDWDKYKSVVEAYTRKYNIRSIELKRDGSFKNVLKAFIKDMNMKMELSEQERENEHNVLALDYLVTYYMLADMWDSLCGNYQAFAANSQIDQISSGKVQESMLKKQHVYGILKQKIAALAM